MIVRNNDIHVHAMVYAQSNTLFRMTIVQECHIQTLKQCHELVLATDMSIMHIYNGAWLMANFCNDSACSYIGQLA